MILPRIGMCYYNIFLLMSRMMIICSPVSPCVLLGEDTTGLEIEICFLSCMLFTVTAIRVIINAIRAIFAAQPARSTIRVIKPMVTPDIWRRILSETMTFLRGL